MWYSFIWLLIFCYLPSHASISADDGDFFRRFFFVWLQNSINLLSFFFISKNEHVLKSVHATHKFIHTVVFFFRSKKIASEFPYVALSNSFQWALSKSKSNKSVLRAFLKLIWSQDRNKFCHIALSVAHTQNYCFADQSVTTFSYFCGCCCCFSLWHSVSIIFYD